MAQSIRSGGRVNVSVDCMLPAGGTTVVAVAPVGPTGVGPAELAGVSLEPPTPSPFRPGAAAMSLRYSLPAEGPVRISVIDVGGRRIARLFDGVQSAGPHTLGWDGRDESGATLRSGVYLIRLETAQGGRTRKLLLLR